MTALGGELFKVVGFVGNDTAEVAFLESVGDGEAGLEERIGDNDYLDG